MDELLGGSLFFIYLISVVTVINYEKLDSKQKMSVLYILTYGIGFNYTNLNRSIWILVISFLCAVFMYEEYWNSDELKNKLIRKFRYKLLDFFYYFIFIYKGVLFILALFVLANSNHSINQFFLSKSMVVTVSIIILVFSIHGMFSNRVEHASFTEIMKKIEADYPYYIMADNHMCEDFERRLSMLADIEDRLFFKRSAYTSFSLEYIKLYFKEKKDNAIRHNTSYKSIIARFKCSWGRSHGISKIKLIVRFIRKSVQLMISSYSEKYNDIKNDVKKVFSRGHSTIEMQLFRTLSFKRGIRVGKPRGLREIHYMIVRKVYEVIFTHVFFSELKKVSL